MKILLLIICLINSAFSLSGNHCKSYFGDVKKEEVSNADFISEAFIVSGYYINLFETENKYELYCSCYLTADQVLNLLISFGTYREMDDCLILEDKLFGYNMYMKRNNRNLVFTKALSILQNRLFTESWGTSTVQDWYNDLNINKTKQANKKKYKKVNNLSCGVYYGEGVGNFYLELDSAGNYCYYVERLPLSKGKWEKKGSEIFLKDDSVNAVFSLLITKEGLVSQLVPGDIEENLILKKIR